MFNVDMQDGWSAIPQTSGLFARLMNGDFDEAAGRGHRTRLVRFDPGGKTFEPFTHDYWEEVYLVSGELTTPEDGVTLKAPAYVIRPPDTSHGPFLSENGCVLLEVQYFSDRRIGQTDFLDPKAPGAAG